MFINKIVIAFLFISNLTFSQTKKAVDTIFVYEKVFIYKTIYKTKNSTQQILAFDSITRKKLSEVKHFNINIVADTLSLKKLATTPKKERKKKKKNFFHIENYGVSVQSLFSKQTEIKSYGGGIGLFVTKNIHQNEMFLNFEVLFSNVFGFTQTKSFDGYYITPKEVLFYEPKNIKTQQLSLPITLYWRFWKIKPLMGFAYTNKQTQIDFYSYPNNTNLNTIQQVSYKLKNNYIDFIYGIEYDITKRIGIVLKSKQTIIKINQINYLSQNTKTLEQLHFFPNQVVFGLTYKFKS